MQSSGVYKTLNDRSEGMYKEKGSKFIGIAVPCRSSEEAKGFLDVWRKEHHQARHLCYAYVFGIDKDEYRANDDGEPNNSAGQPILGQITSFELTNVLIGVVRYYGGVKLGVGGLIHAYKTAAQEAINAGKIIEKEVFQHARISFNYELMSSVMIFVKRNDLEACDQKFEVDCELTLSIPLLKEKSIISELNEIHGLSYKLIGIY